MTKSTLPKRGRPKGMKLTPTDILVIQKVAIEGFQTYFELRSDVLSTHGRTHSWDLLRRLVLLGYLIPNPGDQGAIRGWGITLKGIELLRKQPSSSKVYHAKSPSYHSAFNHDITLREVRKILSCSPCISEWIPEHVLKAQAMAKIKLHQKRDMGAQLSKVPDALFTVKVRGTSFNAALELEMTRKTRQRIYQKLESHITEPSYDFVFFIIKDSSLLKTIWEIYQSVLKGSPKVKVTQQRNGIYFTLLNNLRNQQLKVPWAGEKETLILANLVPETQNISPDTVW